MPLLVVYRGEGRLEEAPMAISAVVGTKLVGLDELDELERGQGEAFSDFLAASEIDTSFTLNVTGDRVLDHLDLARAWEAAAPTDVVPFTGIGFGKPLSVVIETVYVGSYPDAMRWIPGEQEGDVLVSSAHKAFQNVDAAPRAVHLLKPNADRRSYLQFHATSPGSKLVYYTPAVTDASVIFTFELSVDRDFDKTFGQDLSKALSSAAALPVFATAAPYLVIAGAAIPIAQEAADMLARPRAFYAETVEINFERAGLRRTQTKAFVLYPDETEDAFDGYELQDGELKDEHGHRYDGPLPYVVLSVDGNENKDLEGWEAQAASAELLERFFQPDSMLSKSLSIATQSLSLYNDINYRQRAADMLEQVGRATGADKAKKQALYEAYVKNIQNKDIRATIESTED